MLSRVGAPTSLDVPQLLSGASVLGDGSIVLVLDPAGIVAALRREPAVGVTQAVDALDLELKRFPAKTSAREAFGGTARRSRALVVETRHFFLDMIGAALHTAGFEADLALGGDEALVRLRANGPYDLVLVPMDLPGVDPAGLARLVGDARPELGAAVVGLAAHGGPIPQRDARAAGMRCAVGRFDRAALLRAVAAATAPALEIAA
jgi:CheY-like chemotaxis protein